MGTEQTDPCIYFLFLELTTLVKKKKTHEKMGICHIVSLVSSVYTFNIYLTGNLQLVNQIACLISHFLQLYGYMLIKFLSIPHKCNVIIGTSSHTYWFCRFELITLQVDLSFIYLYLNRYSSPTITGDLISIPPPY